MSETASSPSVHLHPLSSSSSVSSTDSAPQSEPTSDEQPDLGAFNLVLREFSHLQPQPRLPVSRRPPTSSTASVVHEDHNNTSRRTGSRNLDSRTSRLSGRSDISGLSSFTRPASSSAYPEGSTVWAHAAIAPYLMSRTPVSEEYDSYAESYQASDDDQSRSHQHRRSRSPASTEGGRTVEIDSEAEVPSVGSSHHIPYSPHPSVDVEVPVVDGERMLDSRETEHADDNSEVILRVVPVPEDFYGQPFPTSRHNQLSYSRPNIHGYSVPTTNQLRPQVSLQASLTMSSSLSPRQSPPTSSSGATQIPNAPVIPLLPSLSSYHADSAANTVVFTATQGTASTPPNTLAPSLRTTSSSAYSREESAPSPDMSLLSYRLPQTPSMAIVEDSDQDPRAPVEPNTRTSTSSASDNPTNATYSSFASDASSGLVSLKTQRSVLSATSASTSSSTGTTQTDHRNHHLRAAFDAIHAHPNFSPLDDNSVSTTNRSDSVASSTRQSLVISDAGSLYSADHRGFRAQPPSLASVPLSIVSSIEISDRGDVSTPDHPPSETIPYDPTRLLERGYAFSPVRDDDEDEESTSFARRADSGLSITTSQEYVRSTGPHLLRLQRAVESPATTSNRRQRVHNTSTHTDEDDELSSRYPYAHTPRTYPQAQTPRGPPPSGPAHMTAERVQAAALAPREVEVCASVAQVPGSNATVVTSFAAAGAPGLDTSSSRPTSLTAATERSRSLVIGSHTNGTLQPSLATQPPSSVTTTTAAAAPSGMSTAFQSQLQSSLAAPAQVKPTSTSGASVNAPGSGASAKDPTHASTHFQSNAYGQSQPPSHPVHDDEHHSTRVQPYHPPFTLTRGNNFGAGYPYSLLDVHELPHSIPPDVSRATENWWMRQQQQQGAAALGTEAGTSDDGRGNGTNRGPNPVVGRLELASEGRDDGGSDVRERGAVVQDDNQDAALDDLTSGFLDPSLPPPNAEPSLGYLDTALAFIAAEREKANERMTSASRATAGGLASGGGGGDEGEGGEAENVDGGGGGAENENSKRRRRRRRPKNERSLVGLARAGDLEAIKRLEEMGEEWRSPILPVSPPAPGATTTSSSNKGKRKDKEFLIPAGSSSKNVDGRQEVSTLGTGATTPSSKKVSQPTGAGEDSEDEEGAITPTNNSNKTVRPPSQVPSSSILGAGLLEAINLTGRKGNRVGRRQREQEKARRDAMLKMITGLQASAASDDFSHNLPEPPLRSQAPEGNEVDEGDGYYDEAGSDDEDDEDDLKDLELLRPPQASPTSKRHRPRRRKKETMAHVHIAPGADGGVYKSTPGTPRSRAMELSKDDEGHSGDDGEKHGRGTGSGRGESVAESAAATSSSNLSTSPSKKKKQRTKRLKQSIDLKKGGIIDILDLDRTEFDRVMGLKNTTGGDGKGNAKASSSSNAGGRSFLSLSKPSVDEEPTGGTDNLILDPNSKRARIITLTKKLRQAFPTQRRELDAIMARFQAPVVLPAVSNLKQGRTKGLDASTSTKAIAIPGSRKQTQRRGHLRVGSEGSAIDINDMPASDDEENANKEEDFDPRGPAPRRNDPLIHVFIDHSNILIGLLNHLKRNPPPPTLSNPPAPAPLLSSKATAALPIPVPSFATGNLARSLPSTSGFDNGDEYGYMTETNEGYDSAGPVSGARNQRRKKVRRHLWHAALTLVLERGRSIARRVVVTSSPLYQPMQSIEYLGYELRVYMRVPDLGDGMDRERRAGKASSSSSKNAPAAPSSSPSGLTRKGSTKKSGTGSSARAVSGNDSGSGSGGGGGSGSALDAYQAIANGSAGRVKFREQGVDELLQLKLHQSLAAQDRIPEGSTIVLATGDGNVGQFNEDGFLGPVRTALRHGWRVELYAWEDGLSRSWKREFMDNSEWGKKGMFQIIPMEPYAHFLFEVAKDLDEQA